MAKEMRNMLIVKNRTNLQSPMNMTIMKPNFKFKLLGILILLIVGSISSIAQSSNEAKTRVIITSDGEIDDECSMVRFLLYANEMDIEGIITSSSQYHWHGHKWAGDDWIDPYLAAYTEVYPNLIKHEKGYPTPDYLKSVNFLGNVETEGEMELITPGSQHIVKVLLDETDNNPIWIQAWGGTNTIARALKTIEEEHPEKMEYVANKIRFFFIWEQDATYQGYIRPHWGKYNILTIISDQFEALAYRWKTIQPAEMLPYFEAKWMKENILQNHGALCSLYKSHGSDDKGFEEGDFRSEGDSPAFIHNIHTGLRNMESPDWGGWAGRYVKVRENTWLDPVHVEGYQYPEGRWYGSSGWGRNATREGATVNNNSAYKEYFKPTWQWSDALQNDFAARADWCVKEYDQANHPPVVVTKTKQNLNAKIGQKIKLNAKGSTDPDGDQIAIRWWQYSDVDSYSGKVKIQNATSSKASFVVPSDARAGQTIHIICEVSDNGSPKLNRYQRIVVQVE
ncbi:Protein of unknown function [Spirosomataceae bacterium TFI 002]|nr:Protein of unknown function [Spirosomataceae bacterium TFI 002]